MSVFTRTPCDLDAGSRLRATMLRCHHLHVPSLQGHIIMILSSHQWPLGLWSVRAQWPILCDPMDCSFPVSSVHGILQARILEWLAISSCRGSSWPRDWTCFSYVSCITGRFFTCWAFGAFLATGCSGQLFLPPDESPAKLDSKHLLGGSFLEILLRENGQYGRVMGELSQDVPGVRRWIASDIAGVRGRLISSSRDHVEGCLNWEYGQDSKSPMRYLIAPKNLLFLYWFWDLAIFTSEDAMSSLNQTWLKNSSSLFSNMHFRKYFISIHFIC